MLITGSILVNQSTKKVVITGGSGYIGSHTAKVLTNAGYHVISVDRVTRPHTLPYVDEFLAADYDSEAVYEMIYSEKPDAIVHCANYLLVGESVVNPGIYYNNNVAKTARFLDQIRMMPKKPVIVFSSSAAVYGNVDTVPINESALKQPINPYGWSKLMIEQMLTDFDHAYGLKSASLRYFNACGADPYDYALGQSAGASHIIARLLDAQIDNSSFILNGTDFNTPDGTCVRDYIHVWDLAVAHKLAIEHLLATQQSVQLNLGTNTGFSNNDVIRCVHELAGNVEIVVGPRRSGDPDTLIADATKAKELLGWQPQYSTLPIIVDTAWKWYQNREKIIKQVDTV